MTRSGGAARKGILLAGGAGTRLHPMTRMISKQLLPVYDRPMACYPLATLLALGMREILVITTPEDRSRFERLLGDGSALGIRLAYAEQAQPRGLAEALLLGRGFLAGSPACLVLGDNLFHGPGFVEQVRAASQRTQGATVFAARVERPERYGVAELDSTGSLVRIVEKPARAPSPWAITGLYLYDASAPDRAATLRPSARGQLEITDLNNLYLAQGALVLERLPDTVAWHDMGTPDSLLDAAAGVRAAERASGRKLGCPEAEAYAQGWIDRAQLLRLAEGLEGTPYGEALRRLAGGAR